jgi:predicted nucleic acid-binding protein
VLEYEAVLTRKELLEFSGYTAKEVIRIVKAFCRAGEPVHLSHRLRPQLSDPDDEFVFETAFHGKANGIVTFNRRDFEPAAHQLGIEVLSPRGALERMTPP